MSAVSAARPLEAAPRVSVHLVEEAIDTLFARKQRAAVALGPDPTRLWRVASETVRGGKLVRPKLLLAMHGALTGAAPASATIEAAAAVELLHYAFLLHDDVIDSDTVRRGRLNLLGAMARDAEPSPRAAHWGSTSAILMGDLVLSAAYQHFARLDVSHEARLRVLDIVDATIDQTVAGELVDVALGDGISAPSLSTILDMAANKTACYTFELPLRLAAVLAEASPETEAALARAGHQLGLAFQLDDDLLGAFGDPSEHGKDPLSDFREAKQTALIASARRSEQWPHLEVLLGRHDLTEAEAARIRALLVESGARERVEALRDAALAYVYDVSGSLATLPVEAGRVLTAFAGTLRGRHS